MKTQNSEFRIQNSEFRRVTRVLAIFFAAAVLSSGCNRSPRETKTETPDAAIGVKPAEDQAGKITVEVLENGLTAIVRENHTAPVAAVRIYVKAGSIYEQEYLGYGISHVCEHLVSGGSTTNRNEEEITERLDFLGGRNNAYTRRGHTCYHLTTAAGEVNQALELMADWMQNSVFPQNEFKREINVIREELRKGREEPNRLVWNALYEAMFTAHPVRWPVIGYEDLIKQLTRKDIINYYQRMYVPKNIVVVAVGAFDKAQVLAQIRQVFSDFNRPPPPALALPAEPRQLGKRVRVIHNPKIRGAYFHLGFHSIMIDHEDLYALDVLSYIQSHGRCSRLVKTVREEQRLFSSIYSYSDTPEYDGGIFGIGGKCTAENVEAAVEAILAELREVQDKLVSGRELEKAKRQKVADNLLYIQTAANQAHDLGTNMLVTGNPEFNQLYLAKIKEVTAAEVRQVARKYLFEDNLTVIIMRPADAAKTEIKAKPKARKHPIRRVKLPSGLTLLVKRNPELPLVCIQGYFLAGVRLEKPAQAGLSRLTGLMLTRGTASHSAEDIAGAFDAMGGRISCIAGNNTFGLNVEVLKEDFGPALDIFADILHNASFPEGEFDKLKQMALNAIDRQDDDWDGEIQRLFRRNYFSKHPYGNLPLGRKETVSRLTAADASEFFREHAVPARGVIAVFGDIDEETTIAQLKEKFAEFTRPARPLPEIAPQPTAAVARTVSKKVARGISTIFVGCPGVRYTDIGNRYPMMVLNALLETRLHNDLRGKRDLVYLAYPLNFAGLEPGYFGVIAASSPSNMPKVQKIILRNIVRIKNKLPDDKELAKAKAICLNSEILSNQTNAHMALQTLLDELYGLGYGHGKQFKKLINKVSPEDIRRVARKYLVNPLIVRTDGTPKDK